MAIQAQYWVLILGFIQLIYFVDVWIAKTNYPTKLENSGCLGYKETSGPLNMLHFRMGH